MSFSPIGKFLPRAARPAIVGQAAVALALEAGTAFIVRQNPALASRTRLVSVSKGMIHALASSAPAKAELSALKEPLMRAMKSAAPVEVRELRVEVRGTLVEES